MQTSQERSEFVRVSLAAQYLGVNSVTILYWIRWGWINAYNIGPLTLRLKTSDLRLLKRKAVELDGNVSGQFDTRYGSILRDSPELFGTHPTT